MSELFLSFKYTCTHTHTCSSLYKYSVALIPLTSYYPGWSVNDHLIEFNDQAVRPSRNDLRFVLRVLLKQRRFVWLILASGRADCRAVTNVSSRGRFLIQPIRKASRHDASFTQNTATSEINANASRSRKREDTNLKLCIICTMYGLCSFFKFFNIITHTVQVFILQFCCPGKSGK